jgi:hypothetical protein
MNINIKYVNPHPGKNHLYDLIYGEEPEGTLEEIETMQEMGESEVRPDNAPLAPEFEAFQIELPETQDYAFIPVVFAGLALAFTTAGLVGLYLKPMPIFVICFPIGCVLNIASFAALHFLPKHPSVTLQLAT